MRVEGFVKYNLETNRNLIDLNRFYVGAGHTPPVTESEIDVAQMHSVNFHEMAESDDLHVGELMQVLDLAATYLALGKITEDQFNSIYSRGFFGI